MKEDTMFLSEKTIAHLERRILRSLRGSLSDAEFIQHWDDICYKTTCLNLVALYESYFGEEDTKNALSEEEFKTYKDHEEN